jgi:hypothetical protein
MKIPELCVEVGEMSECMSGDVLLTALLIECCVYFILFVSGFKIIEWVKKQYHKRK